MKRTLLRRLTPALMLAVTAVSTAVSNGFTLDTRPSPWTLTAILEKFSTLPAGLTIIFR